MDYDFVAVNNWAEQKKELIDAGKLSCVVYPPTCSF